jgi:hypothetical protein
MEGPHCPKCGAHNLWAHYSGPEENPDALRCTNGASGLYVGCSYIYWRRNAPASEPTSIASAAAAREDYLRQQRETIVREALEDRRARVRALVLATLQGNPYIAYADISGKPTPPQIVLFAQELDTLIESVGVAKDEQ